MARGKSEVARSIGGGAITDPPDAVSRFLAQLKAAPARAGGTGRLIFALDATASRQPTWDQATRLQAEMFQAAAGLGGLSVQLVFYRGHHECKASAWTSDTATLLRRMTGVSCLAGHTQLQRVLRHAAKETRRQRVSALVFVGDALEEKLDDLGDAAGELGLLGLPSFLFQEGHDPRVRTAFEQIARLTGGACCAFDAGSAEQLKALLGAVAAYAAGGRKALLSYGERHGGAALLLTRQLR